jgi:hypothetical protein
VTSGVLLAPAAPYATTWTAEANWQLLACRIALGLDGAVGTAKAGKAGAGQERKKGILYSDKAEHFSSREDPFAI